jgi:hypothetical protein
MPINFLTNNDITGGNSGSPVLNGKGELIGLAFDGNIEAMAGDVIFDDKLQRTINVDIQYVFWLVDKLSGADNIIKELTINTNLDFIVCSCIWQTVLCNHSLSSYIVSKRWFLNRFLIYCHISSHGFSSGLYGRILRRCILSGTSMFFVE